MNDEALFQSTVPVFQHYLRQIDTLLKRLPDDSPRLLACSLAAHAFSAAEHLDTAMGFALRTVSPLTGREFPSSEEVALTCENLLLLRQQVDAALADLDLADFDGAAERRVVHSAGMAELEQCATTFVTLFAMPNFYFHLSMAFAIFRREGVDIGKSDFDGQHVYEAGFHF